MLIHTDAMQCTLWPPQWLLLTVLTVVVTCCHVITECGDSRSCRSTRSSNAPSVLLVVRDVSAFIACTSDEDCKLGEECDPSSGTCIKICKLLPVIHGGQRSLLKLYQHSIDILFLSINSINNTGIIFSKFLKVSSTLLEMSWKMFVAHGSWSF